MSKVSVVCVSWGNKFSDDYVLNLKAMVERNTTVDHEFICFTDRILPKVDFRILDEGYEGWWNKLQLFNSKWRLSDRVVYFDLDTLITGDLDWLMNYDGKFMGIEDVGAVNSHQPHLKNVLQTGVMAFDSRMNTDIWSNLSQSMQENQKHFRGDGELLNHYMSPLRRDLLQHLYPGRLKSYKYQVYPNRPDKKTSIICFHGRPSIEQAMSVPITTPLATYKPVDWISEYWRR